MAKKKGKSIVIFLIIVSILGGAGWFGVNKYTQHQKETAYKQGIECLAQHDYYGARVQFEIADDYQNAPYYYKHSLAYSKSESATISAKVSHTAVLKKNGTVVCVGYQEQGSFCLDTSEFKDITAVSTGFAHTVGLKSDGTVIATRFDTNSPLDKGQCDVKNWKQIVQISANSYYTLGLTADGTVKFAGDHKHVQKVTEWKDIIAISAGGNFALGLKSDGTVVSTDVSHTPQDFGQADVSDWKNITQISAGQFHAVGVCEDGSVKAVGKNDFSQTNVSSFKNIKFACATYNDTYMITKDGSVVSVGANDFLQKENISDGVKTITGGNDFVCMVLEDGSRLGFGENSQNQCAIEGIQK